MKYNFNHVEWEYILRKISKEMLALGGYHVDMDENNGSQIVKYEIDGEYKCFCFNMGEYKRISNIFDNIYGKRQYFLKSYLINGKIRAFTGEIDYKNNEIYPIAFDLNKQKYTRLILDKDGLIDENEMVSFLESETDVEGFNPELYKKIDKCNILNVLYEAKVDFPGPYVMQGLSKMNKQEKISVYTK